MPCIECAFTPTDAGVPVSLNTWCIISTTRCKSLDLDTGWSRHWNVKQTTSQLWPGTTVIHLDPLHPLSGWDEGIAVPLTDSGESLWALLARMLDWTQDNSYVIWHEPTAAWSIDKVCIPPILSADVTTKSNGTLGANHLLSANSSGSKA